MKNFNSLSLVTRNRGLTGILESTVASLELTAAQRASVEKTYTECGEHLSRALGYDQHLGDIFPQGSMRLGTVIRPYRDITEVFDLDLVFRIALPCQQHKAGEYCQSVGKHLRNKFNGIVKPLPKGWRLDYSETEDYYLDIIPAMDASLGGSVIAICDGDSWKESNPRGYAEGFFEPITRLEPRFEKLAMFSEGAMVANRANIEPLPEHKEFKLPLQRIAQISKRHRDYYFNKSTKRPKLATPSIVLTTLLALSYRSIVPTTTFSSGFELLVACVAAMPVHLEKRINRMGTEEWWLPNPSLPSENLIQKWHDGAHASGFFSWHREYLSFLKQLQDTDSSPRALLSQAFGAGPVTAVFQTQAQAFAQAKIGGNLSVDLSRSPGLSLGAIGNVSPRHLPHGLQ